MSISRARTVMLAIVLSAASLSGTLLLVSSPWAAQTALAAPLGENQPDGSIITPTQTTDGTWGPGTITAVTDIVINPGVVITIAPNTTVLVANGASITVQGNLHTSGPVTFTTAVSPAVPGAWDGITYAPGSSGYLNRATVEYAKHGITLNTGNPVTVSNSTLRYNQHAPSAGQDAFGAGLAIISGTHLVTNTHIHGNILVATGAGGDAFGGGVDIQGAGSQIINSFIYNNIITSTAGFAVGGGIAIHGDGNSSLIEGCQVTTNTLFATAVNGVATYGEGSGIGFPEDSDTRAVIRGNLIAGNVNRSTVANGGGVGLSGGAEAALIAGNVIYNNLCESPGGTNPNRDNYWAEGGGIDTWDQNRVTVTNNLILSNTVRCVNRCYANTGPVGGGMMVNGLSSAFPTRVVNNTLVGNRAEGQRSGGYGGGFGAQTYGIYVNNIVVGNSCTASNCGGAFYWWDGLSVDYSLLWGNTPNDYSGYPPPGTTHDVSADPLFADTNPWGYHLSLASPARDAGTGTDAPGSDFEGDGRPLGWGYDIGWDETGYLEFSKHTDAATTSPDLPIQYTVRLTNTDLHVDAPIVVSDTLDANLHWISGGTESDGVVVLTGTVPAGDSIELSFVAAANRGVPDGTVVTNTAYVLDGRYISPTNSVTTTIYSPVLTLTKEAAGAVVGTPLTYTLHVSNTGAGVATNVVVTDAVPLDATYLSGGAESGGVISWTIPAVAPGSAESVTFTVRTCRESLTNADYRVVTSTQGVASPPGPPLVTSLNPPSIDAGFVYSPSTPVAGETVHLTSTSATDGSPIVAWSWSIDGSASTGEAVTHTFNAPGTYGVTLFVTDTCGYTATTTTPLEVYALLSINIVGAGSVSADPSKTYYTAGEVVTLTATADPGWSFAGWSGDLSGATNPATLTITGHTAVTATFTEEEYTLTANTVGNGGVALQPDRPTYRYNDVVTLTATADPGWSFAGWSGDLPGATNPATLTITGHTAVTATFSQHRVYIPLVMNNYQPGPDLVIESLEVTASPTEAAAMLVVRNTGPRPAGSFWVELYVDPTNPPTGPNQPWQTRGCAHGVVWRVTGGLGAGQTIELTTEPGHGERSPVESQSDWPSPLPPGEHTFYAYADSWGDNPNWGAVLEENEGNNRFGPLVQ